MAADRIDERTERDSYTHPGNEGETAGDTTVAAYFDPDPRFTDTDPTPRCSIDKPSYGSYSTSTASGKVFPVSVGRTGPRTDGTDAIIDNRFRPITDMLLVVSVYIRPTVDTGADDREVDVNSAEVPDIGSQLTPAPTGKLPMSDPRETGGGQGETEE